MGASRLLKNGFYVILNEVKDLELINMTRFFASLRMTHSQLWEFFNNLIDYHASCERGYRQEEARLRS